MEEHKTVAGYMLPERAGLKFWDNFGEGGRKLFQCIRDSLILQRSNASV